MCAYFPEIADEGKHDYRTGYTGHNPIDNSILVKGLVKQEGNTCVNDTDKKKRKHPVSCLYHKKVLQDKFTVGNEVIQQDHEQRKEKR